MTEQDIRTAWRELRDGHRWPQAQQRLNTVGFVRTVCPTPLPPHDAPMSDNPSPIAGNFLTFAMEKGREFAPGAQRLTEAPQETYRVFLVQLGTPENGMELERGYTSR